MTVTDLLELLRGRNVELRPEKGKLKVHAPAGVLTDELKALIRERKDALLDALMPRAAVQVPPRDSAESAGDFPVGSAPLSFAQKRLWFLNQLDSGGLYNVGVSFSIGGELDIAALEKALNAIVSRHSVLRTVYDQHNGEPFQKLRENGRLELDRFDVAGSDAEREAQWTAISTEYAARPFDLAHDLMLRVGVVPFSADQTRLMIHMHHIASDGWSVSIFVKELNRLYETIRQGDEVKLEPLPLQYSDYARWQDDTFRKADYIKGWAFWQDYLRDLPEVHSLPLDAPRPSEQSYRGSVVRSHVPKVVARHLSTLGQEHGATLFMTLYSALTLLLSRYTGEDDVVLGTPIAGRDDENIEAMIGCFVNTLVLRARVDDDDSFEEFLKQCRLRLLDVYEYQHVPFEYLVEALKPSRSLKYNPLFQVMFALHNQERASFSLGEGGSTGLSRDSGTSKFDLSLDAIETADGIGLMWRYASDIFREESILRLDSYFQELLRSIVEDAKRPMRDLSVLPESVRQQLLDFAEEQDGSVPMPASLGAAFERIAEQFPSRLALSAADSRHSYAELMQAVEDFANTLRAAGVGYGDRVGVHLESSPELVITTLALFKLGAVYVPLDPDYPKQRLRYMMADSGARLVLARPAHRARMEDLGGRVLYWGEAAQANSEAVDSVPSTPGLDSVAYIFYTSGSTGEPKGVVVSHGNVLHYHDAVRDLYGVSGEDRVLQFSSPSFDIFIEELTVALLGGGTLVIGDRAAYGSFWGEVEALGITIASLPTAYWHLLCTELGQGTVPANVPLRLLIAGGEKMCVEQLCQWQQVEALAEVRVLNTYGPTEATVIATAYDAASHQPDLGEIPIGAPLRHSHCVIRDARDELVLPGAVGELTIAGSTVALGYLGRPEQSAAAFGQVHDRHGHAHRSYRTGDLVRLNSDGVLEYVGRSDDQIKISGFRISTGEIERQMLKVPGLSVAMVLQDGRGTDARLLAVLVPEVFAQEAQHEALIDQVYHHVKAVLPYYMCPSGYAVLPALPLTDNGKVARSRLLDSSFRVVSSSAVRAPETDTEVALARLWSERLRVDLGSVGRNTSFFEVGGHSLLAIRLLNDIQQIFGKRFSVRQIFETPVLGEFARRIDEQAVHGGATISADSSPSGSAPASFAQKQLWYLDRISEAPGSYNISSLRRFQRELNLRSVEEAVARIVRRHGALRTRFEVRDFDLFQTVAPDVEFLLGTIDASGFPQSEREAVIRQKFQERARQPFGLDTGLLLRMDAVVEEGATVLQLRVHHIAADGWSIDLFWREFDQEYASLESGARTGIPHVALQYIDYSVWQHRQLQDGAWNDLVCFWKQQLGDLPKLHSLALDYPRPEMQSFEGASYLWSIDSACHKRLKALAASSQTSLFTLFHAAFSVLIARRSGNSDVVVATPAANRDRPEVAGMIGLLANLLVLRTNVEPGVRFSDYLQSVRQANIDAQDHQDIPFEYLVETLNPQRSAAHNPLAQIVLNVEQRATAPDLLDAGRFSDQEVAKFDLSLNVVATTQGLTVGLNYCKALFSPFTITRIAEQFSALLDDLSLRPDALICELNLLGENQREQLLELAGQASFCGTEPGDRLYVLDDSSRLVPYGFEGELYVGGPRAVAAFGEDAAGGAGMAPSPISCEPALYFTGNRVRFDHKGVLVASFDGSTRYWKKKLRDLPPRHGLPLMDSGLHERSRESESYDWRLASKTEHLLQVRARDHGLDVWTLLQSGLSLLMSRYAGDADVALGTRGAHRPRSKFELRRDALVLRLDCAAEQTVAEYLEQVRKVNLEALAHCDLSFEEIVERLGVPRDECFNPLFQVMLVLDDAEPSADGESVSAQSIGRIDTAEDMDIVLHVSPGQEGYGLGMSYRKALFPRWLIVQMAEDLTRIFEQLVQGSTARLKDFVLSGSGLAARANQLDGDGHDEQFSCLHALVERQVQRTPDAVALRCDESSISYAELNARANRLAHALIARGVHPGTLVGVCLPRSPDLVVSLLAILKAGAAYVPLDPDYPVERLQYIAADAELACVLGSRDTCAWLEGAEVEVVDVGDAAAFAACGAENPSLERDVASVAYLIYTSGTTGKPKGVMIEHRNAAQMLAWAHETYSREQLAVVLAATSMCFDLSVFEMFVPLTCGGSCLLVKHILDLHEVAAVRESGVTLINTVPSAIMQLLEAGSVPDSVQVVNLAGEALLGHVVDRVYAQTRVQAVFNLYGPSEDTTYSTYSLCTRDATSAPDIGTPIRGCQAFVVDRQGLVVPRGVAGELYIGGTGLSRGYWRRPELTAEKFVSGESVGVPLPRLYRTGDLVRCNELGVLEFIGRLDQQVKLNGFRIELGEIESALSASGVVKSSAVLKLEDERGQRLAAFVEYPTTGSDIGLQEEQARAYLRANLPGFMLPQEWVAVDAMPLSANGKIDRKAVRARYASDWSQAAPAGTFEEARNPEEQWVVDLWKRLLKVEKVGLGDNFFALGGKSLLALQLINAINKQFGCRLTMVDVFRYPTIRELLVKAGNLLQGPAAQPAITRISGQVMEHPASSAQTAMWLIDRIAGGSSHYNVPFLRSTDAKFDADVAERVIAFLIERHESFRTTFSEESGALIQRVVPMDEIEFVLERRRVCRKAGADKLRAEVGAAIREQALHKFELSSDVMLRAVHIAGDGEGLLLLNAHHIAVDGWSIEVFWSEYERAYQAFAAEKAPDLLPLPVRYIDYTAWQDRFLSSDEAEDSRAYWRRHLAGVPPRHGLPMSEEGLQHTGHEGESYHWHLPLELSQVLQDVGAAHGASAFMMIHAGLGLLVSRYAGNGDVVIGTPVANRLSAELEPMVGLFTNTLVLRIDCAAGQTVGEYLKQVLQVNLEALTHQHVPFEQLVELLNPPRSEYFSPVFQILLTTDAGASQVQLGDKQGINVATGFVEGTQEKVDLAFHASPNADGYRLVMNYRKALFPRWLIVQMAEDLTRIFEQLVQGSTAQLKDFVLSGSGLATRANQLDGDGHDEQFSCLHALVERQVQRTPDAVALRCDESSISYAELNARANRLAHALIARGVQPGTLVGVCLPRSPDLVVSLLAILKAGAAYVPLDPDYPVERLQYIAADAELACVLGSRDTCAWLEGAEVEVVDVGDAAAFAACGAENPSLERDVASVAYLIYTSGTTGKPKGVMIEHRNAAQMLAWAHETYSREQLAVVLAATSMCFDLSVFEMFVPLTCGGSCLLVKHILDLHEVAAVRESGVTLINTVPSAIMQLLEAGSVPDSVQVVNLAGEALLGHVVDRVYAQTRVQAVFNLYGPSEDTTYSTYSLCTRDATSAPDIGIPIRGCQAFVVDRQGLVVPRGVAGELYIGGTGLSRGYWRRPELTAEKFVSGESVGVPLPRLYRTGDLVRCNELGVLEFIGRLDQQVKLNGFRIELGEIESALSASGVVKSSAVLKLEDERGQRLAAFVEYPTTGSDIGLQEEQARAYLRANLPGFMLPQEWVAVDAMPLSANGKIDRKAVRARYASDWSQAAPAGTFEEARNPEEQWVVDLWKRLLKVEKVGLGDNFFALGGKSLLALQLINAINKQFGCRLTMVDVFRYPTIRELLPKVTNTNDEQDSGTVSGLVRLQQGIDAFAGQGRPSLFLVHPIGGDVLCYLPLVEKLDRQWDVYGLQVGESHQHSVEDLARGYIDLLRSVRAQGPCHLAGYSLGGTIAFEMARQLDASNEVVCSVSLIDSMLANGASSNGNLELAALAVMLEELGPSDPKIWRDMGALYRTYGIDQVLKQVLERGQKAGLLPSSLVLETLRGRFFVYHSNWAASRRYSGGAYRGDANFLAATVDAVPWELRGWDRLARFEVAQGLDCSHFEILKAPHVERVAEWLLPILRREAVEPAVMDEA